MLNVSALWGSGRSQSLALIAPAENLGPRFREDERSVGGGLDRGHALQCVSPAASSCWGHVPKTVHVPVTSGSPRADALAEHCAGGRPAQGPASPAAARRPAGPSLTRATACAPIPSRPKGRCGRGCLPFHPPRLAGEGDHAERGGGETLPRSLLSAPNAVSGRHLPSTARCAVPLPTMWGGLGSLEQRPGTGSGAARTCPSTPSDAVEGQLRFAKLSPIGSSWGHVPKTVHIPVPRQCFHSLRHGPTCSGHPCVVSQHASCVLRHAPAALLSMTMRVALFSQSS